MNKTEMQEWNLGQILETSGSYWKTCALHAGVRLDVFTVLGDQSLTAEEVANKLNGNERGVETLLNALSAMNLLSKAGDRYSNAMAARNWLSRNSQHYMGHIIRHHHHLMESWARLHESVMTGKPIRGRASHSSEEWRESFLMGMFNLAMNLAPQVAEKVDLTDRRHLLDLGGGPGTYAIHFCLKNPQLKATVYDLSTTRPFAEKTIESFGLSDRIHFMEGDYLEQGIEGVYDVAWLSHILHGEGPEDCERIIQKTVERLEPGGMILIHEFVLNNTLDGPLFPALFSLNMLLGTEEGRSYSEEQIGGMLARAGVKEIQRIPFQGPNDSGIIAGRV